MLVLTGEGGESRFDTNINFFLEEFGICVNSGKYVLHRFSLIITLYTTSTKPHKKYLHPNLGLG